jgi:hypothetical protein
VGKPSSQAWESFAAGEIVWMLGSHSASCYRPMSNLRMA